MLHTEEIEYSMSDVECILPQFEVTTPLFVQTASPQSQTDEDLKILLREILTSHQLPVREEQPQTLAATSPVKEKAPRHRRRSHIAAEQKRRKKINELLKALQDSVPSLKAGKSGELESLEEAGKYIEDVKRHDGGLKTEIQKLKKERDDLKQELNKFQLTLPSAGIAREKQTRKTLTERFYTFKIQNVSENWKYAISLLGRELFDSYNKLHDNTDEAEEYVKNLMMWTHSSLTLTFLRPVVISGLKDLATNTSILAHPSDLRNELTVVCGDSTSTSSEGERAGQSARVDIKSSNVSTSLGLKMPKLKMQVPSISDAITDGEETVDRCTEVVSVSGTSYYANSHDVMINNLTEPYLKVRSPRNTNTQDTAPCDVIRLVIPSDTTVYETQVHLVTEEAQDTEIMSTSQQLTFATVQSDVVSLQTSVPTTTTTFPFDVVTDADEPLCLPIDPT